MDRKITATAALFGALGIILGAFGAHALKKVLTPDMLTSYETGVKYQIYHALFLLFVAVSPLVSQESKKLIYILTVTGVVLFSGSIYLLSCNVLFPVSFKSIGFITPIGGLLLIAAWVTLFLHLFKRKV